MRENKYRSPLENVLYDSKRNLRRKLINVGTHPVVASVLVGQPKLASDYLGIQLNKTKLILTPDQRQRVDAAPIPQPIPDLIAVVDEVETMRDLEKPYTGNIEALEQILSIHRFKGEKVMNDYRDFMLYETMLLLEFTETEYDFSALLLEMNYQLRDIQGSKEDALQQSNINYDVIDLLNLNIQSRKTGIETFVDGYRAQMLNSE